MKIRSCEWRKYGEQEYYVCTADKKEWFEKVDTFEMAWSSAACVASLSLGSPAGCIGYAKWFLSSLDKILK